MKKLIVLAVAVAVGLAFSVYAGDEVKVKETIKKEAGKEVTTEKIKTPEGKETIKTVTTADETKTTIKAKNKEGKEKVVVDEKKGDVKVTDVTKNKKGEVWKETVKFEKIDEATDYIYVMKDDKVVRLKHKLSDKMEKDMLKKKKGDQITITSTYPLSDEQLAVILEAK